MEDHIPIRPDRSLLLGRQTSKWSLWDVFIHESNSISPVASKILNSMVLFSKKVATVSYPLIPENLSIRFWVKSHLCYLFLLPYFSSNCHSRVTSNTHLGNLRYTFVENIYLLDTWFVCGSHYFKNWTAMYKL